MSHAMLLRTGLDSRMWSVARGFARTVDLYKDLLANADAPRYDGHDCRGMLSERALIARASILNIAHVKERQAREITSRLLARNVFVSETPRAPLRLHCPIDTLEAWFPGLYPPFSRMPETGAAAGSMLGMM